METAILYRVLLGVYRFPKIRGTIYPYNGESNGKENGK